MPMLDGMGPERRLEERSSLSREVISPMSCGNCPERKFLDRSSVESLVSLLKRSGLIVPRRLWFDRSRPTT